MKPLIHTYEHIIRYGPNAGETETVNWKASAGRVKGLLGLSPTAHFPAEGLAPRDIQGVQVYVTAARNDGRRKHRVFAICPCGRHIPAGRMFQHKCDTV
jgi:hypothetical protein